MKTIADTLVELDKILEIECPDAVVIYGDTNSCLGVIAVKRRKIPIFHFQAGNRSFDQNVPQQINRKIIDHISDVNIVNSQNARRYLIQQGIKQQYIVKLGSPMYQILYNLKANLVATNTLEELELEQNSYILASIHRQQNTNTEFKLRTIINALQDLSAYYNTPILISMHPKTKQRMAKYNITSDNLIFHTPFGLIDYCNLQLKALCVVSDSGTITQQASILQFRAVTIRYHHQRPEGTDAGIVIMTNINRDNIVDAVKLAINLPVPISLVEGYNTIDWSTRAIKLIYSYTDHINKEIWRTET